MDVERILRNTPATLTVTFYTDEVTTDADGAVTVTVKRADGSTLSTGSATHVGAVNSGKYAYSLAAQGNLNNLTVDWAGVFSGAASTITTFAEIVGGHYFTIAELRGWDIVLADTVKYPLAKMQEARDATEVEFERICHRAFVPRFAREIIEGDGADRIWLSYPEASKILTVNGLTVVSTDYRRDGMRQLLWPNNVFVNGDLYTIEYEYGLQPTPLDIKRAALRRARGRLVGERSRIDERATVMQIPDFGTFNLATPGKAGSYTGIPDIDVVLEAYMLGNVGVL